MAPFTTSCLCKATGLELTGQPQFQVLCHCTICQKLSGSDYAHNMAFTPEQVTVVKGDGTFLKFKSSESLIRHMCSTCGCLMFGKLGGDSPNVAVPVGTVDRASDEPNKTAFKPQHHIFYDTRVNDVHDDLPKWAGFMDDSEKLG